MGGGKDLAGADIAHVLRLRAHHLLCILGYRGLGYNDRFVGNMTRVVELVRNNPELIVEVINSPDVICSVCPRLPGPGDATTATPCQRAGERDNVVLMKLGLISGARSSVGAVLGLVRENISAEFLECEVCLGCSWYDLGFCVEGLAKLKSRR